MPVLKSGVGIIDVSQIQCLPSGYSRSNNKYLLSAELPGFSLDRAATFIFAGRGPLYRWDSEAKRPIISLWVHFYWEDATQCSVSWADQAHKCLLYSYVIKHLHLPCLFQKTPSLIKTQKSGFVFKCSQFIFSH